MLRACAIIVAGGVGSRAIRDGEQGLVPKQLQMLGGKPVIAWSLEAFAADKRFTQIVIVCADSLRAPIAAIVAHHDVTLARGGATRTDSVRSGLAYLNLANVDAVFIHDAARPGLNQSILNHLFEALEQGHDGAAPVRLVADALWHVSDGAITTSQDRDGLLRVQTPQAFQAGKIKAAYEKIGRAHV